MKEKIESINFNEISLEESQELLNELLTYDGEEFKELVTLIIDSYDELIIDDGKVLPKPIELLFNNDRVSSTIDELLEECEGE